jgi:hypothetical protein
MVRSSLAQLSHLLLLPQGEDGEIFFSSFSHLLLLPQGEDGEIFFSSIKSLTTPTSG